MGHENKLKRALETAAVAAGAEGSDAREGGRVLPPAAQPFPKPTDAVDSLLLEHLRACHSDGSLACEIKLWNLDAHAVISELLLLATAPARITEVNPVLSRSLALWYTVPGRQGSQIYT